jgi:glycerol-3-phosphate acyltransferase PlsY
VILIFVICVFGYLIGSIPIGYLVGRLAGIDIRTIGSGNVGATNVVRTLGKRYGYPVFLLDFLKGFVAVRGSIAMATPSPFVSLAEWAGILGGICAVIGHSFPVWLRFKGGKGVATSGGVVFGLMPMVAMIAGVIWLIIFQLTRYVSIASIVAVASVPCACGVMLWLGYLHTNILFYFSIALAVVVVVRHRANISRLARGGESRFERK